MYAFNADAIAKIAEATRLIARRPKFRAPEQSEVPPLNFSKYAIAKGDIPAKTGLVMGVGKATLQTVDRDGTVPILRSTMIDVPVENGGGKITSGSLLQLTTIDGALAILTVFC